MHSSRSPKIWYNPSGEVELLSKLDIYDKIASVYHMRPFGMGVHFTEKELAETNVRRTIGVLNTTRKDSEQKSSLHINQNNNRFA